MFKGTGIHVLHWEHIKMYLNAAVLGNLSANTTLLVRARNAISYSMPRMVLVPPQAVQSIDSDSIMGPSPGIGPGIFLLTMQVLYLTSIDGLSALTEIQTRTTNHRTVRRGSTAKGKTKCARTDSNRQPPDS